MRAESEESREVGRSRGVVAACVRLEKACPTCGAKNRISSGYWSPLMRESPSRSSSSAASSSACGFYFAFSSASNPRSNCMPFLIPRRIALALRDQLFVTCDVFVVHEWLHFNLRLLDTIQGLLRGTPGKSVERVTIASLDARPHRALSRHHSIARGTGSLGDQEFAIFRNHPSATSATKEKPPSFSAKEYWVASTVACCESYHLLPLSVEGHW
jgi:hypothetical protein